MLIGGDFMAGRFVTAPYLCAVILLFGAHHLSFLATLAALLLITLAGLPSPRSPLRSTEAYGAGLEYADARGIGDERAYYYPHTGLLTARRDRPLPEHRWIEQGRAARQAGPTVAVTENIGLLGFYAGPQVHIVDEYALADPLLARLPAQRPWRIGHFKRVAPPGYLETLARGRNVIADPQVARYYERLSLVTRGPLLDAQRLTQIVRLNVERPPAAGQ
ncbi:MAG: hypothetical protein ACREE7_12055 [Dongiaceae bacterium]